MSRWWRFYNEALHDPKALALSDRLHRAWVNLLCVASKNGGVLPPAAVIAIELRTSVARAAEYITALVRAELLDQVSPGVFAPHNWNARQYKSDVSTERVKRFRQQERNVSSAVSETPPETDSTETDLGGGGDAREPLVSKVAIEVTEEIAKLAGFPSPDHWPPGWCGAPMRMQSMLNEGWIPEIMVAATREAMAKKRDGPPESLSYFEKPFARAHARQAAPFPVVKISTEPEVIHATAREINGRPPAGETHAVRAVRAAERAAAAFGQDG